MPPPRCDKLLPEVLLLDTQYTLLNTQLHIYTDIYVHILYGYLYNILLLSTPQCVNIAASKYGGMYVCTYDCLAPLKNVKVVKLQKEVH